jgi:hypothetical protein
MQTGSTQHVHQCGCEARRVPLALEIAAEARAEWGYTSDLVSAAFRQQRQLGSSDRRLVAETVYGLVRWERRLEAILDEVLARRRERREPLSPVARG